ncbi:DUF159 family protein [Nocardiopsis ansamitocini]|uniref:Abasic site processing protein n=1 Tax=Nocardiopsis ansamitocini TaxID=1670832 RepID=A0A9W6P489_9ACTN|nr:DUF159 family protein [Nocardiopsis ansamitocini]
MEELAPDYNISPGKHVYAVLGHPPAAAGPRRLGPQHLVTLRWGLVPSWAKDPNVGYRMINARSETVAEKPAFRDAFARRRCLIPADAYYEWQLLTVDGPGGARPGTSPATDPDHKARKAKAGKRPFAVHYGGGRPLALAGIFERWRNPELPGQDPAAWLWSVAVITAEAEAGLARIHERMPVVVGEHDWETWLDADAGQAELQEVLAATPVTDLTAYEVDDAVNTIRNNGPDLLAPRTAETSTGPDTLF